MLSPAALLSGPALLVVAIILFAECGLLLGFFLPGDTLLLATGIAAAAGMLHASFDLLLIVAPLAATAGNLVGYWIGYRTGPRVFDHPGSRLFRPEYAQRARAYFGRFGSWTVLIGRFVPIVRTVATVMAGVGRMQFGRYVLHSVIGAVVWTDGLLLVGRALGETPFVQANMKYVDYAVIAVIMLGLLPTATHFVISRRRTRARPLRPDPAPDMAVGVHDGPREGRTTEGR